MTAKELLKQAGLADSHWGKRIIEAERRGRFLNEDRLRSKDWTMCACGTTDPRIPRDKESGSPIDDVLRLDGESFTRCVFLGLFAPAAGTLIAIEQRAAELTGATA